MLAKFHMKSASSFPQLQCNLCFQFNYQLLQCQGPCFKLMCRECTRRRTYRPCQFCQEELAVDYLPTPLVIFQCPAQCQQDLKSEQQFQQHCRNCEKIEESLRQRYIFKKEYKCDKGHRLKFPLYKTNCTICDEYHYTSRCDQCDVNLCTQCRPPPCSKEQCPLGHQFQSNPGGASVICDLCGISLSILTTRMVYGDRQCNFDICLACHSKLPETHPQPNYKNEDVAQESTQSRNYMWHYIRSNAHNPPALQQQEKPANLPVDADENLDNNIQQPHEPEKSESQEVESESQEKSEQDEEEQKTKEHLA